jgi:hypothetical protein
MIDERAQRVPLYTGQTHLSQYMYQFLFCSNNPMSVGREVVHAKTGKFVGFRAAANSNRALLP